MKRRDFCAGLGLGAAALAMTRRLKAAEPVASTTGGGGKPNIIYILADDLGYGDLACQNPKSKIPTPNLDRLAAQGVRFTDAHAPTAVCTPTRYAVLTGRYCWRSSLKRGVLGGFSPPLIEPGRLTVPALLKQHGYATACVGKWHLGLGWQAEGGAAKGKAGEEQVDFTKPVTDGPCTRGFDYFFGIPASLDMPPYVFIETDRVVAAPTARQEPQKEQYVRAGPKDPDFTFEQVLPRLTRQAVGWIGEQAGKDPGRPLFLYFALNAPHTPVVPTAAFKGKSGAGDYGDFVVEVDWTVGEVLKALDEHNLADNTLVIVTSDNGPERLAYERIQQHQHYSMGDLRGLKRDTWEGGHRVPFLARWPGKIRPGSVSSEVICLADLMATASAIVGAELPASAGEDSYNILPALVGEKLDKPIREATVHHSGSGRFAIRQGQWVFIDAPSGDENKEPDWLKKERGYQPHNFPGELYDLSQDLSERRNLYGEHPEIVQRLKTLLEKYRAEGRSAPRA
ncbi:MAG TPA: sulfatase-like hydrolase/transferase [Phycisphaerae bacterium]|nr:sulfatase-like hydrolase/transferase [Phycisphaerae bacterium]